MSDQPQALGPSRYLKRVRHGLPVILVGALCLLYVVMWVQGFENIYHTKQDVDIKTAVAQAERSADRDLMLARMLEGKSYLIRRVVGVGTPQDARATVGQKLIKLGPMAVKNDRLRGLWLVSALTSEKSGEVEQLLNGGEVAPGDRLARAWHTETQPDTKALQWLHLRMNADDTAWWEVELAMHFNRNGIWNEQIDSEADHAGFLAGIALLHSLAWMVPALIGVFFLPYFVRKVAAITKEKRKPNYLDGIKVGHVLVVFVIGEGLGNLFGKGALATMPDYTQSIWLTTLVDTVWRLIPVVLLGAWLFNRPRHMLRAFLMKSSISWGLIAGGFALLYTWNTLVYTLVSPFAGSDPIRGVEAGGNFGFGWMAYGVFASVIVAPVVEEVLFRGFLFQGLTNRFGVWIGVLGSAAVFALAHYYAVDGILTVAALGVVNALLYRLTGSLVSSIALHAMYNAVVAGYIWPFYLLDPMAS